MPFRSAGWVVAIVCAAVAAVSAQGASREPTRAVGDKWIDVFDLRRGVFARRIASVGSAGAWLDGVYYVLGSRDGARVLTRLDPDRGELSEPAAIAGSAEWAGERSAMLTAARGRLIAWTRSAPWLIRRGPVDAPFRGLRVIDPTSLRVERHDAPGIEIGDVAASRDGDVLYVVVSAEDAAHASTLMRVDAATGRALATRLLPVGFRSVSTAAIPRSLVPAGDVTFTPCPQ